jgi:hypothetical protein
MSYETIADIITDIERRVVLAGVPAIDARAILIKAESALVNALASVDRRERQFMLDLKEIGPSAMKERIGCSRAQVYILRDRALNKLSKSARYG